MRGVMIPYLLMIVFCCACARKTETAPVPHDEKGDASPSPQVDNSTNAVAPNPERSAVQDIEFKDVEGGRGRTRDGTVFSFHLYEAVDGVGISTTIEKRGSRSRAHQEMRRKIAKGDRIIELGPKLNDKGKRVGERAVVIFPGQEAFKPQAAVIWTIDSDLFYIESPSLDYVLKFEKKYYQR
jgi:hypothetical protein